MMTKDLAAIEELAKTMRNGHVGKTGK